MGVKDQGRVKRMVIRMDVHIQYMAATDETLVYITVADFNGSRQNYLTVAPGGALEYHVATGGGAIEPLLRLNGRNGTEVLRAIAAKVGETMPPDQAVERHLKDAIQVRDRLLVVIEKSYLSNDQGRDKRGD